MEDKVREKIVLYREKLDLFKMIVAKEMQKDYHKRDVRLLDFLYKERVVYQFALHELESLIV